MNVAIEENVLEILPATVRNQLAKMPEEQQAEFSEEFNRKFKPKSVIVADIMWLFGFHYAYYGKWMLLLLFWLTLGGFYIWWIVDFFRMSSINKRYNQENAKDIAMDVLKEIKILNG